jgi:hypothetical protein
MSVVGGCIIGATVSVLQARFGMLHGIGVASFIGTGAVAGFAGSMVSGIYDNYVLPARIYSISSSYAP